MVAWKVTATELPWGEEPITRWVTVDGLSDQPIDGAEPLPGGFMVAGLVDAHSHPTLDKTQGRPPGDPVTLAENMAGHLAAGVLLIRDAGAPPGVATTRRDRPSEVRGRWRQRPLRPRSLSRRPGGGELGARGGAWTPTLTTTAAALARGLGVAVLAGTDVHPPRGLHDEIAALVDFGLSAAEAISAASTAAREYLRRPATGANLVTYDTDPRRDLSSMRAPAAVVRKGRRVR